MNRQISLTEQHLENIGRAAQRSRSRDVRHALACVFAVYLYIVISISLRNMQCPLSFHSSSADVEPPEQTWAMNKRRRTGENAEFVASSTADPIEDDSFEFEDVGDSFFGADDDGQEVVVLATKPAVPVLSSFANYLRKGLLLVILWFFSFVIILTRGSVRAHTGHAKNNLENADDDDAFDGGDDDMDVDEDDTPKRGTPLVSKKRKRLQARSRRTNYLYSQYDMRKMKKYIDDSEKRLQQLPPCEQPVWIKTALLPHQLQGVQWARDKTCAILADDMGLGKTIQTLSILAERYKGEMDTRAAATAGSAGPVDAKKNSSSSSVAPSLVVCPKSTIANWLTEIKQHVDNRRMVGVSVKTNKDFQQKLQQRKASDVRTYDMHDFFRATLFLFLTGSCVSVRFLSLQAPLIVVVSYNQVFSAFRRVYDWVTVEEDRTLKKNQWVRIRGTEGQCPYFDTCWSSIVLDEAHNIKNDQCGRAAACARLESSGLRLCLTGTPIQNSLDDLYALVKFLKVPNYCKRRQWTTEISPRGFVSFANLYTLIDRYGYTYFDIFVACAKKTQLPVPVSSRGMCCSCLQCDDSSAQGLETCRRCSVDDVTTRDARCEPATAYSGASHRASYHLRNYSRRGRGGTHATQSA